ncbi:MAG: mannonate dehydratase [Pirellulales bacterium]|nr:mannonate dehydratase [Pirellulales bacterium]MBL7194662.1 mannonate dehydratase [Pirellulales bacterium]
MKLAMLVNPFTERNLALAAQAGVEEVVLPYPGPGLEPLRAARRNVEAAGMRLTVLERKIPHRRLVHRLPGWEEELAGFQALLRNMADAGLQVACYNWMPAEDWQRTTCSSPERGGSLATAFDLAKVDHNVTDADGTPDQQTPAAQLWETLTQFLDAVLPVAEACGVSLALHPDDPPLPVIRGQEQIIGSNAALRRVVELAPSPANGICYCTGSLFPAGADLVAGIRDLAPHIRFVHARNVRGTADRFAETWHDNGEIDMPAVIRELKAVGFEGPLRPDHAPSMAGEANETPGYEMLGKLFALGYLRGLLQAA